MTEPAVVAVSFVAVVGTAVVALETSRAETA